MLFSEPKVTSQVGISKEFNLEFSDLEQRGKSFTDEQTLRLGGIRRVSDDVGHQVLGIDRPQKDIEYSGLVIPYFNIWDKNVIVEFEIRRDKPDFEKNGDGVLKEKRKYVKPRTTKNHLYIPPMVKAEWFKDKKKKLFLITEGAIKALSLARAASNNFTSEDWAFIPMAISGVDNFKTKTTATLDTGEKIKVSTGLSEFEKIDWNGAKVIRCFDSDADTNPNVKAAGYRFDRFFRDKQVKVFNLKFPKEFEGIPTKGIDDYLGAIESKYDAETAIGELHRLVDEAQKPKKVKTPIADNFKLIENGMSDNPGVYFTDENGETIKVCSPLKITAETQTKDGENYGRLLEWNDSQNRRHRWAMPIELVHSQGAELAKHLAANGLEIMPSRKHHEKLAFYIATSKPEKVIVSTDKIGWHGDCFVLPNETFGESENEIVYQTEYEGHHNFKTAGTLSDWQDNISKYCPHNSRLLFAVSVAFAAAMLWIVKMQGGGFHFRGSTSTGKTTASLIAGSVCGGDSEHGFVETWRSTANGLEITAAGHNHNLLCLDEIGECEPREVGRVSYMIANGKPKGRMTKTLQAQKPMTWNLLFLSTGEQSLADIIKENGGRAKGGQEIRLCDINANTGKFGLFENLHDFPSGQAFSDHLRTASCRYYGTAIREWLTWLAETDHTDIREQWHKFKDKFINDVLPEKEKAPEEVSRVAARFALVALGGELASEANITKWQKDEAYNAAKTVFLQWMDGREGGGQSDIENGIRQVRQFIQTYEQSRFQKLWSDDEEKIIERVGFIKMDDERQEREFLIFPGNFKSICKGFDSKAIADAMKERHILQPDGTGKTSKIVKIGGKSQRFYVITERIFIFDETEETKTANA